MKSIKNYIYCIMLGVLDQFWPRIVRVTPPKTPFGLLISLFTVPVTLNYSHSSLIYYAVTRLHSYSRYTCVTTVTYSILARIHSLQTLHSNLYCTIAHKVSYYNHLVHSCTGWLLSCQLLCRIITHFPSSHFPCLSPIERLKFPI
jgi:hypothetical protein